MKNKYKTTLLASYIGYIVQAIVNNLTPLLYVQFSNEFLFEKWQITILIVLLFTIQIMIDYFSSKFVLKLGYRKCTLLAHSLSLIGLILLGFLPYLIDPFFGILIPTLLMGVGGGFIEVVVSPIIDALPNENKSGSMSLLHSFYSWGHILVVLLSTGFFYFIGIDKWRYLPFIFVIFPLINLLLFAICPLEQQQGDKSPLSSKEVFKQKYFIFLFIAILASGASEIAIAQWGSYFAEASLKVDKTLGDLLGICLFAFSMALSRSIFGFVGDKINLVKTLIISSSLLVISYLIISLIPNAYVSLVGIAFAGLFVGILWPGIYSIASNHYPNGGTRMFSLLALGGDIGCISGPSIVGLFTNDIRYGILLATIFPLLATLGLLLFLRSKKE